MYLTEVEKVANAAVAKKDFLVKNPAGYFIMSMIAGMFIGIAGILTNTIGGLLNGAPYTKILMGAAFSVALSLVVIAGAELFTGNNMVMFTGYLKKKITLTDAIKLWVVCWIGNLCGALLLAVLFHFSGLNNEATGTFLAAGAAVKESVPFLALLIRSILCNFLVCLAVWCGFRTNSDTAKLIMVFWCLFAFVISGYEHSVANMTQLIIAQIDSYGQAVSLGGIFYNLLIVTIGNIIGGIFFASIPYYMAAKKD